MRVFEYHDIQPIIQLPSIGDIIVVNPDVFSNGRHYAPEAYKKMVRKVFKKSKCDIIDIGPVDRPETKERISNKYGNQIFWYAGASEISFINGSCHCLFRNAMNRDAPEKIDPQIAEHVGTAVIKFMPETAAENKQQIIPVPNPMPAGGELFYIPIVNGAPVSLL